MGGQAQAFLFPRNAYASFNISEIFLSVFSFLVNKQINHPVTWNIKVRDLERRCVAGAPFFAMLLSNLQRRKGACNEAEVVGRKDITGGFLTERQRFKHPKLR